MHESKNSVASISRREGLRLAAYGGFAALTAAFGLGASALAQQPAPAAGDTATEAIFEILPDWSHVSAAAPLAMGDLVNLKDAAIAFLKRVERGETAAVERELSQYVEACCKPGGAFDEKKASGLFLLFRIVFDLPDLVGATEVETFGGWYAPEDAHGVKQRRESDDFHPSWPIYIARISNKLYIRSNSNPGSIGAPPAYRVLDEYRYMRGKYKFRTSAYIKGLEFVFIADK